ncbi:hypothetical protein [Streptomyces sp. NPDC005423]|uniref:hypothetical protein n=1 Tax=Streptomyces sp. NPDC005423 TaxID=3155343 RepID=UPI0033B2F065
MNQGEHYKLFVLLSDGPAGSEVRIVGGPREGEVHPNQAKPVDETAPALNRTAYGIIGTFCLALMVLAGLVVQAETRHAHPAVPAAVRADGCTRPTWS